MPKFTKGHTLSRGKRTGRKKLPATIVNEAIKGLQGDLPELFNQLKIKALSGDREAAVYLIDRAIGKPKASTEIDLIGGKEIGVGLIMQLIRIFQEERAKLLEAPGILQIEGGNDESIQRQGDEDPMAETEEETEDPT